MEKLELIYGKIKKPTIEEIKQEFNHNTLNDWNNWELFQAGVDFVLKYNEEQRDVLKVFNIGFDIDVKAIKEILESENDVWDEYEISNFEGITDVLEFKDKIRIKFNMKSNYGLHKGLDIEIDNKGRVFVHASDTPWEGSSFEDEIEVVMMKYTVKQKYL